MLMMMPPLLRYFWFHSIYSLAASCSLQSAVCSLQSAVCGLQSAVCSLQMSYTVWVLASSGFYSITWRMVSRSAGYKIHFQKQPLFRGNVLPCRCFVSLNLYSILCNSSSTAPVFSYNQINKQPENLYVNCRVCFGYFTHLAGTSLF